MTRAPGAQQPDESRDRPRLTWRRIAAWLLAMGVLATVGALSLGPDVLSGRSDRVEGLAHAAAYAVVTGLVLAVWGAGRRRPWTLLAGALIAAAMVVVSIAVELAQQTVGRDAEWRDVRANAAGVSLAFAIWALGWTLAWAVRYATRSPGLSDERRARTTYADRIAEGRTSE